jgi:hypothetical protein
MSDVGEALKLAASWDRCYPGNVNHEYLVDKLVATIRQQTVDIERLKQVLDYIEAYEPAIVSEAVRRTREG